MAAPDPIRARFEMAKKELNIDPSKLKQLTNDMIKHLERGLKRHRGDAVESSLAMLETFVDRLPQLTEPQVVYGVDFGGSNLRVVRLELDKNSKFKEDQRVHSIMAQYGNTEKNYWDAKTTATELMDKIAEHMHAVMQEFGDADEDNLKIGFTFSYPCEMKSLKSADLIRWTKEWRTGEDTDDPVVGRDVCQLFNEALSRRNLQARVYALTGDTVGAMISCECVKTPDLPPCLGGVILGTGVNGCYWEPRYLDYNYQGSVINIEAGGFDAHLPLTEIDHKIDEQSASKGTWLFEKMMSGALLGEIGRHYLLHVLGEDSPSKWWQPKTFSSADLSTIAGDTSAALTLSRQVLMGCSNKELDYSTAQIVHEICHAVMVRSARLASVLVVAVARATRRLERGVTIGIDGTLYLKNKWYRHELRKGMICILGPELSQRVFLLRSPDGSGKGAALVASSIPSPISDAERD